MADGRSCVGLRGRHRRRSAVRRRAPRAGQRALDARHPLTQGVDTAAQVVQIDAQVGYVGTHLVQLAADPGGQGQQQGTRTASDPTPTPTIATITAPSLMGCGAYHTPKRPLSDTYPGGGGLQASAGTAPDRVSTARRIAHTAHTTIATSSSTHAATISTSTGAMIGPSAAELELSSYHACIP